MKVLFNDVDEYIAELKSERMSGRMNTGEILRVTALSSIATMQRRISIVAGTHIGSRLVELRKVIVDDAGFGPLDKTDAKKLIDTQEKIIAAGVELEMTIRSGRFETDDVH